MLAPRTLTFRPSAQGIRLASLQFRDNAAHSPQTVILFAQALAGTNLLDLNPDESVFPPTGVGSSELYGFSIQNNGTETATVTDISISGANASDFVVSFASCGALPLNLPPGDSCDTEVTFTPSATGGRTAELDVFGKSSGDDVTAVLAGQGQPDLLRVEAENAPVNFSSTSVGGQTYLEAQFLNSGNIGVFFSPFNLHGSDAGDFSILSDGCSGMTGGLPPQHSCYVQVGFSPSSTGIRKATLNSTENSGAGSQSVLLVGAGSPAGDPLVASVNGQFSSVVGVASQPIAIDVTNRSQSPATLAGLSIVGGNASDFSIFENSCNAGRILSAGNNCQVFVVFTPGTVGARVSDLQLSANAGGLVVTHISLAGEGLPPAKILSVPSAQSFTPVPVGILSEMELTISNSGEQSVSLTSFTLVGRNATDVTILNSSCMPPSVLQPGQSCYSSLQFIPAGTGARIVSLRIADDASGSPQFVSLDSFGLAPQVLLSLSPDPVSFGTEVPGVTSQAGRVYVQNAGNTPVNIASFSITGGEAGDFSFDSSQCPATLPMYGNCIVSLSFAPSQLGIRAAEFLVNYGAPTGPASVFLTGEGVAATRSVGFSPVPVNFDDAATGATVTQTAQIDNLGTAPVTVSGLKIAGANAADFSVQSSTCTGDGAEIQPGQSCSVTLAFTPSATGQRRAALKVLDNAAGSPQGLPLAGVGIAPSLTLDFNPSSLPFGPETIGNASGPLVLSVFNTGNVPVAISNFAIAGLNALDFGISYNACGSSLPSGQSCTVFVTFTPLATGPRIAQLQVRDDAVGSPQAVQLTGTGQ